MRECLSKWKCAVSFSQLLTVLSGNLSDLMRCYGCRWLTSWSKEAECAICA